MLKWIMFAAGLILLIKGGDWFVDGSCGIARKFHIPELLIGATVVSIGTTFPEVMVSATSALSGHGDIAYGNAIGSIICNTSLIAALTVAIMPSVCDKKALRMPVAFFFGSAIIYSLISYTMGTFQRWFGILLLIVFIVYMVIVSQQGVLEAKAAANQFDTNESVNESKLWKDILFLVIGAVLIAVGANWLVHYGTQIAEQLGVPESVIALTFVALGTSLPELVTAITALIKKHGALSLGNIIGANLFNLVLVSGLSITLSPFDIPVAKTIAGYNASLIVDIPVMLVVMGLLTIPPLIKGKLKQWQGILLLCIYAGYVCFQFAF